MKLDKDIIEEYQCWFTPWHIIISDLKLMNVDWADETNTWLENSCGNGISLYVLKRIYMFTLRNKIKNPKKREEHILENMLFGCDILEENIIQARKKLGIVNNGPGDKNIIQANSVNYNFSFSRKKKPITFGHGLFEEIV